MTVEYNQYLENVDQDDILDWQNKVYKLGLIKEFFNFINSVLRDKEVFEIIHQKIVKQYGSEIYKELPFIMKGGNAKVLKSNSQGWKKGKIQVKLVIEFIPDEPEIPEYQSPLDEIRNHPSFPNS